MTVDGPKAQLISIEPIHGARCGFSLATLWLLLTLPAVEAQAGSVVLPQISGVATAPACASSANGTGHIICVLSDSNHNLRAVSLQTVAGGSRMGKAHTWGPEPMSPNAYKTV